ncbi:MAG: hypothetical protein R3316_13270 [Rhodovibrionaceae bacterium]|nr:hypothetical protein [Rhodovibrionaceae bacterium]
MTSAAVSQRDVRRSASLRLFAVCAAVVLLALSACQTRVERNVLPEITFRHKPPLQVGVAQIEVVQAYRPPMAGPHVDHLLQVTPADVARNWARDRLAAAGSSGKVVYTIADASVVQEPLETDDSLLGTFKVEQAVRYNSRLEVEVSLQRSDGSWARAVVEATRSLTVAEDASLNERERAIHGMIEKLGRDFDAELEPTLRRVFGSYIAG